MADDDLPKVTVAHLARAERICPRRLAQEHASGAGNRGGTSRWRVSNQVGADVRLVHTDLAVPTPDRFPAATDLAPEQAAVYELATKWYVTLFADRPVRAVDEDPWATDVDGVRLVGQAGMACTDAAGAAEIRLLAFGGRSLPGDLLAAPAVRFALLRRPEWFGRRPVRVVTADLVLGTYDEVEVDTPAVAPEIHEWLNARVDVIRERVARPVARAGLECGWCPFVAGCDAHR